MSKRKRKKWTEYPKRMCRWLNECSLCDRHIKSGEIYYDGGFGRRAHENCVRIVAMLEGEK